MSERPKLYLIPLLFEQLEEALIASKETGEEIDPALANSIMEIGPDLIDSYSLFIEERRKRAKVKRDMAAEFTEAARKDEATAEKMNEYFKQILIHNFNSKAETQLGTYSVKRTVSYDYGVDPKAHPEFFRVEYNMKKTELNEARKAGTIPEDIVIHAKETESVVVRR